MAPSKPLKQRRAPEDLEIGQKIRALRVAKDMSQTTLAAGLGVTFQQVQKYERGANRVSAARLQKIADMLDAPITFFYGSKKQHQDDGLPLIQSKGAIRILRAYEGISSGATRHALVMLAEAMRGKDAR
jgi:transcriptional regulator with XRE-family HTH domain